MHARTDTYPCTMRRISAVTICTIALGHSDASTWSKQRTIL